MTDRLTIADASKYTPQQFARHIFGPSETEIAEYLASLTDEELEDIPEDYRFGERFRRALEEQQQLTECRGDPLLRRVA